jgi:hypothetical protein
MLCSEAKPRRRHDDPGVGHGRDMLKHLFVFPGGARGMCRIRAITAAQWKAS